MRRASIVLFASLIACASAHARVIELHANAGFDRDIAGVRGVAPEGGSMSWSDTDLTGDAGSGALMLTGPAGSYVVEICAHPEAQLKPIRHFYEFSVRARGGAGAALLHEGIFTFAFEDFTTPCEGGFAALVRRYATIGASTLIDASIPAYAWTGLSAILHVTKPDDGPLLIDDWSVHVDEDMIFRDDDQPATVFSL